MLVYHGGIVKIEKPKVDQSRQRIDFGQGFYTTTLKSQAEKWAKNKSRITKKSIAKADSMPIVNVYDYTVDSHLHTKKFKGYNEEWLMFVVNSRRGIFDPSIFGYDVIEGNIADDAVVEVVNNLIEQIERGRLSDAIISAALQELEYQQENDQICFKTKKSLEYLKFKKCYEVENA
ncbi:MAG: DUF3990 domain-containing protein [Candidatus Ancillula sp.]|jgi:hypothetical protein|nr:DUF3990 domain-containing protein [Candidatus Ancillula sp.]